MTHVFDNGQVKTPEILSNMCAMLDMLGFALFSILVCWLCYLSDICMCLCCLLCVLHVLHYLFHFYVFIHLHPASHLGTLDEPREGNDGGPNRMMEGLNKCCHLRCRQDGAS